MQWHAEPRNGQFYATHDKAFNNDRSPWNLAEKLNDTEIINIAGKFARIRVELRPYLWEEAQHCVNHSRPMMAHLCLDYRPQQYRNSFLHPGWRGCSPESSLLPPGPGLPPRDIRR